MEIVGEPLGITLCRFMWYKKIENFDAQVVYWISTNK